MKKNCKGFVLLETLIVTVFITVIFVFLYSAVIPLLGKYENLTDKNNIDDIYKLYHLRKLLYNDSNYESIISDSYNKLECSDFEDEDRCSILVNDYLNLENDYELIYVKDVSAQKENASNEIIINNELKKYVSTFNDENNKKNYLFFYNSSTESVVYLSFTINE